MTVAQYKACSDKGECKRAPTQNDWEGIGKRARAIYDPLCNINEQDALAKRLDALEEAAKPAKPARRRSAKPS